MVIHLRKQLKHLAVLPEIIVCDGIPTPPVINPEAFTIVALASCPSVEEKLLQVPALNQEILNVAELNGCVD